MEPQHSKHIPQTPLDLAGDPIAAELERRMFPRYSSRSRARLIRSDDRMRFGLTAEIWNISIEGMGIVLETELSPGEWLGLTLTNPVQRFSCEVRGSVLWSEALGDGKFRAGVRFLRRLSPLEVSSLRGRPREDSGEATWM